MSASLHILNTFLADYGPEKLLKKLIGRTDVEDALLQLDLLTKEESLMVVAKNLEVVHHVDGNINEIRVLAKDIDDKVQRVDQNVKTANECTQWFLLSSCKYRPYFPIVS